MKQFIGNFNGVARLRSVNDNTELHAQMVAEGWEPHGWEMPKPAEEALEQVVSKKGK